MKKQGLSDYTINFTRKALNFLDKHVDLSNPEQVKEFVAYYDANDSYKRNLCYFYEHYLKTYGLTWIRPKYRSAQKMPKIPTEEKLNMIISASRPRLALKLLISKETGMRPIEVTRLRVRDVDLETGNLHPSTAKHGSGRRLKIKQQTLTLIKNHIAKRNLRTNDKLFKGETSASYSKAFRTVRNRLAKNMADPSIKSIRLYDLPLLRLHAVS